MARKSRKQLTPAVEECASTLTQAAIYIRLSVETERTKSASIETQKMIIDHFLQLNPDIQVFNTYIDDGATGTNFHRAGFQKMLNDIEAGLINCVIVKDLSRLGRNSIDTGYYIEQYFPQHHVRFIAVTDQYDSDTPDNVHAGIILPLKNMINEAYSIDIGRKIKSQCRQAMKDGKYVGGRTPYGFLKAPDDCHKLIVDPVAAPIVKRIFQMAADGAGLNTIVRKLNEENVIPPSQYKQSLGLIQNKNLLGSGKWQTRTLSYILHCELYTGDMVQGHHKTIDHKQIIADADNLIIVPNTHEAIVSHELFQQVQSRLEAAAAESKKKVKRPYDPNPLKGKIFCAHCGKSLHWQRAPRKKTDDIYLYSCLTKHRVSPELCPGVLITSSDVFSYILDEIKSNISEECSTLTSDTFDQQESSKVISALTAQKTELVQKEDNLQRLIRRLYEDFVQGVIDLEEYTQLKTRYEGDKASCSQLISEIDGKISAEQREIKRRHQMQQASSKVKTLTRITPELIEQFIERVDIEHDHTIHITYKHTKAVN